MGRDGSWLRRPGQVTGQGRRVSRDGNWPRRPGQVTGQGRRMGRDGTGPRRPGQVTGQGRRVLRRFGQLPGWLKVFMAGQFLNAAGAVAWLYLTLYLVSDRHLDPAHAGLVAAAY